MALIFQHISGGEQKLSPHHASTRTTQLYDRRRDELTLDEVERVVI
jgi:hypothetical protein